MGVGGEAVIWKKWKAPSVGKRVKTRQFRQLSFFGVGRTGVPKVLWYRNESFLDKYPIFLLSFATASLKKAARSGGGGGARPQSTAILLSSHISDICNLVCYWLRGKNDMRHPLYLCNVKKKITPFHPPPRLPPTLLPLWRGEQMRGCGALRPLGSPLSVANSQPRKACQNFPAKYVFSQSHKWLCPNIFKIKTCVAEGI